MNTNDAMSTSGTSAAQSIPSAASAFNPQDFNLDTADPATIICYLQASKNEYDGGLGVRISALVSTSNAVFGTQTDEIPLLQFVILLVSSVVTFFPVLATRSSRIKVPLYVYLFARYFGAGVIVATAFIQ